MWVVGLQFKNVNKVQLDLTEEIRSFTNVVYKFAGSGNMNRENLNLDARSVIDSFVCPLAIFVLGIFVVVICIRSCRNIRSPL